MVGDLSHIPRSSERGRMDHLLFIGSVHTLFTAVFLITKRARSLNDTVLAVWMVFITLPLISGASVQTWPDIHIPILSVVI
jgi:hypothetical protein